MDLPLCCNAPSMGIVLTVALRPKGDFVCGVLRRKLILKYRGAVRRRRSTFGVTRLEPAPRNQQCKFV